MAKSPTGKRPVPGIPSSGSPKYNTTKTTIMGGKKGTKDPTGKRPVPGVPSHNPPMGKKPGGSKPAIKQTSMPVTSPNRGGKGRAHGG